MRRVSEHAQYVTELLRCWSQETTHCNCWRKNLRPFDLRLTCDPSPPLLCSLVLICVTAHNILYCTAEGNMEMVRKRLPLIRWPLPEIHIMETERTWALDTGGYKRQVNLGWPIAPSNMSPNAGEGGEGLRGLSQWVQPYTGAQITLEI